MSSVFITDIIGTGTYAVPENDTQLLAAKAGFDTILTGVGSLTYESISAWVTDSDIPAGPRQLNCLLSGVQWAGAVCPTTANTTAMLLAIKTALEGDSNITSVSVENVNIVDQISSPAGAGAYIDLGPYEYTQAQTPIEEVIEQFSFEGSAASGLTVTFKCSLTPIFTVVGTADIRLYDLGPVAGSFGTPRLVSTLQATTSGLQVLETSLSVVSSSPGTDDILAADRLYEVVVFQDSAENDTVYVGFARLEVRP